MQGKKSQHAYTTTLSMSSASVLFVCLCDYWLTNWSYTGVSPAPGSRKDSFWMHWYMYCAYVMAPVTIIALTARCLLKRQKTAQPRSFRMKMLSHPPGATMPEHNDTETRLRVESMDGKESPTMARNLPAVLRVTQQSTGKSGVVKTLPLACH